MKIVGWILGGLILGMIVAVVYVRAAPFDLARSPKPNSLPVGDYPVAGGFYAVRTVDDAAGALAQMEQAIMATDRTTKRDDGVFVTRSKLWGFPDVTRIWSEGQTLHISGHLVYGRSDLGVNRARIEKWLAVVGL